MNAVLKPAARTAPDTDIVMIGGGHNGLVCAAYLAAAGLKVTVLERRDVLGGAAVTEEFHPGFRNSVAAVMIVPFMLWANGLSSLHTKRPFGHFLRSLSGVLGNASFYYAYMSIPLSDGMTISMAMPIFATILAIPLLGEKVGMRRWIAILIGFGGVVVARYGDNPLAVINRVKDKIDDIAPSLPRKTLADGTVSFGRCTLVWRRWFFPSGVHISSLTLPLHVAESVSGKYPDKLGS